MKATTPPNPARTARPRPPAAAPAPVWWHAAEPWLIPGAVLLLGRLILWSWIPYAAEDAYITFRYARNFAAGSGLVFNPAERVFGFSSPLWTLWCAAGIRIGVDPLVWARATTLVLELAAFWVLVGMLRRQVSRTAAWTFAGLFAGWPYFAAVAASGMENSALFALITLAAAGSVTRRPWAGAALGAVALMRPEGLVAMLVLLPWAQWRDRVIGLAIIVVGVVALAAYFGNPVPQSLLAKSQLYGTPGPIAGRHWWEWMSPLIFGRFPMTTEGTHVYLMVVALAPACVIGVRRAWALRTTAVTAIAAACLSIWAGYAVLGVAYFWWYLMVPLAGLFLVGAIGFGDVVRGRGIAVAGALVMAGLWSVAPSLYIGRAQNEFHAFGGAANTLARLATPGDTVMAEPIGMIGYGSPVVVIDEIGLVSPRVAERRMRGAGWYTDIVAAERPRWLVVRRGVLEGGSTFAGAGAPFRHLGERDALLGAYESLAVVDSSSGLNALVILRRR